MFIKENPVAQGPHDTHTMAHMVEYSFEHTPGTLQSSKMSSQVLDPLMPSLSSFCAVENPGIPYKTHIHTLTNKAIFLLLLFYLLP